MVSTSTKRPVCFTLAAAVLYASKLQSSVAFNNVQSSTHHYQSIRSTRVEQKDYSRCLRSSRLLSSNSESSNEFIRSLLTNEADDDDPYSIYTHQIAIPLGDASELHSALHSIQTSLVRDCPRLIRACIMPALLRLPLLYVDGSSLGSNIGSNSGQSVESILESVS